jgi:TIR domain
MATPEPNFTVPKTFISYSWDDDAHKDWVKQLATRLRAKDGVDVTLDRWHAAPGDQIPAFMERAVRENDFVIAICTPRFKERSDGRGGGVGYEGDIMTAYAFTGGDEKKFIPVLRRGSWKEAAPTWLLGRAKIDLSGDPYSESEYEELLRTLHGAREEAPPIGHRPNFGDKKGSQASPAPAPVTQLAESSTPQHQSSVTPFMEYRKLIFSMVSLGSLNAILEFGLAVGPPWPDRSATIFFTVLWTWALLIWSFSIWRSSNTRNLKYVVSISFIMFIISFLIYINLKSFFVFDTPKFGYQVASGFIVRKPVLETLKKNPDFTVEEALDGASYDSTAIWEPWTVQTIQSALLISWLSVLGFISLLCSSFLLLQGKVRNLGQEPRPRIQLPRPREKLKTVFYNIITS